MSDVERRYTKVPVEMRARDDKRMVGGYAAVFHKESKNLGGFIEQIDPRAFDNSRGDGWPDVIARYNHDDNMLLGSTGGGTLRLRIDGTGLDYEVDLPSARSDIFELVERGDIRKSSFAFRTIEDDWEVSDQNFPMRTLLRVQLVDVAPVNVPAYTDTSAALRELADTSAALRSLAKKFEADIEEVRKLSQENELRKFFMRTDSKGEQKKTFGAAARMDLLHRNTGPQRPDEEVS